MVAVTVAMKAPSFHVDDLSCFLNTGMYSSYFKSFLTFEVSSPQFNLSL